MRLIQQFRSFLICHIQFILNVGADGFIVSLICHRNDSSFVIEIHGIESALSRVGSSIRRILTDGFEGGLGNDLVVDEMDVNWMLHEGAHQEPVLGSPDLRIVTCPAFAEWNMAIEVEGASVEENGLHSEFADAFGWVVDYDSTTAELVDLSQILEMNSVDLCQLGWQLIIDHVPG